MGAGQSGLGAGARERMGQKLAERGLEALVAGGATGFCQRESDRASRVV